MSFFNRVMASVGIGSAKVDTRLAKDSLQAGEEIKGVVHIEGGNLEQQIDNINLFLMTMVIKEVDDKKIHEKVVLETFKLTEPITVQPKEKKEVPFSFILPYETPLTIGKTRVWLQTGLDINMAVDPTDNDYINIIPDQNVKTVLDALDFLGFRLREVECEYAPRLRRLFPVVQEFEFVPTTQFRGRLDELEVIFLTQQGEVEVLLEIDKKARGLFGALEEAFNLDERFVRLRFRQCDVQGGREAVATTLSNIIASRI